MIFDNFFKKSDYCKKFFVYLQVETLCVLKENRIINIFIN